MAVLIPILKQIKRPKLRKYLRRKKPSLVIIEEIKYPLSVYSETPIDEIDREAYILIELGAPAS